MSLPEITAYRNNKAQQTTFGGLKHTAGAGGGDIYDMQNLSSRCYPVLAPREKRLTTRSNITNTNGIFWAGALYEAIGTTLYRNGTSVGSVTNSKKKFCALGERVLIFPDKLVYENSSLKNLEASYSAAGLKFHDGTYAEEEAEANSITTTGNAFPFNVGDAVEITGCTTQEENNKTPVIREISDDGKTLRFYENTFTLPSGQTEYTESGTVTLARKVPDMDYVCTNENRVWGCKGDSIFASSLGDPYNWYVFDDAATSSFSVEAGTAGDFTACASYLGYPCFFKEDKIIKMYGSYPSNFQTMSSATLGVAAGSGDSLAVAGEKLYYLSRSGIVVYSGGLPNVISQNLGEKHFKNAVGGSDGEKYYVSMQEEGQSGYCLYVFDAENGLWHKEDNLQVIMMAYTGNLYAQSLTGTIIIGASRTSPSGATEEQNVSSFVEFADFDYDTFSAKKLIRIRARLEVGTGGSGTMQIKYDNGSWETVCSIAATGKDVAIIPCPIRRCNHFRIKFTFTGDFKIYALEQEYVTGGRK